jgi:hypothetical protein
MAKSIYSLIAAAISLYVWFHYFNVRFDSKGEPEVQLAVKQFARGMGDLYGADLGTDLFSDEFKHRLRTDAVSQGYTNEKDINTFITEAFDEAQHARYLVSHK